MTESSAPPTPTSDSGEFLKVWSETFSQVLTQTAGTAFSCTVEKDRPAELGAGGEGDQWIVIAASGSLRGEMSLQLQRAAVLRLGQIFMSEPPAPEAELTADHGESVVELLRQVSGIVCTSGQARWGEFQLRPEAATAAPSWPPAETFWLRATDSATPPILVEFGLSAALIAQLRAQPAEAAAAPQEAAASPVSAAVTDADSAEIPATLELLKDVQLAMTMRFGARTLLLREVLDLSPGTVVELDRKVQEPVDLLLDGKLIARGEVVVIEGSYGLRVTEICPPANA